MLAYNELFEDRDEIIGNCEFAAAILTDTTEMDEEKAMLEQELEVVAELVAKLVNQNATLALDQTNYLETYNGYAKRYETATSRLKAIEEQLTLKKVKADAFNSFITALKESTEPLIDFDDSLWCLMVDKVVVNTDDSMTFHFIDGSEVMI